MAGHSEYANKKHRKEKSDSQRSKIFTKVGREIAVAVKLGGPDVATNQRLATAILKAKAANMPNDNIARAIKSAAGMGDKNNYEQVVYECYGPGGTAFIVEALTDNKNRTAGDVRHIFDKSGGSMGTPGCVGFMFDRKGVIVVEKGNKTEDDFMLEALDLNVDDYKVEDEVFVAFVSPSDIKQASDGLQKLGYNILSAQAEMVPQNTVSIEGNKLDSFEKLLEKLDDNEDIQEYYHNANE